MKLYIIGFMASLLAAFLIFFQNNKFMPSKVLIRPGQQITSFVRQGKNTEFQNDNILVRKILESYKKHKISYKTTTSANKTRVSVNTALFGVDTNEATIKKLFSVIPIAGNYSILVQFYGQISKDCKYDCNINIKPTFELRNDISQTRVDPKLCRNGRCYFLDQVQYSYSVRKLSNSYETKFPKSLQNINLEEAFKKMFSKSINIEQDFPVSDSNRGHYNDEEFHIMDESEDFPEFVDLIVSSLICED